MINFAYLKIYLLNFSGEERIVNWNEDLSRLDSDSELTVVLMYPKLFNPEHKIVIICD